MQDHTPVQHAVTGNLFKCRKVILGEATQAVHPDSAARSADIEAALEPASRVALNKIDGSTWEIMQCAIKADFKRQ